MEDTRGPARIAPATPATQTAALNWLLGSTAGPSTTPLSGLWEAWRGPRRVGVAWGETRRGATAIVWPPIVDSGEPTSTAEGLWKAALDSLAGANAQLAQVLLPTREDPRSHSAEAHGFRYLTELLYLAASCDVFPTAVPSGPLTWEPYRPGNHHRLVAVVESTYVDSLDCPGLVHHRSVEQVLEGYRGTDPFQPALWRIARFQQQDVGCLLLTQPPEPADWELTYLGVAPAFRGRGFGRQLVEQAKWLARLAGRRRLVLAVDANNHPALEMYAQTGFWTWDRRSVFVKAMG